MTDEEIEAADALTTDELLDRFKRGHPTTVQQVVGVTFGSAVAKENAVTLRPVDAVVGLKIETSFTSA